MNAAERHDRYHAMDRKVTGPQRRRMKHKARCRKTHTHFPEALEPCSRCRPPAQPEKVPFRPWN